MSYYISVIKDSPVGFWKLDETSGSVAYDSSGCGNNGSYSGGISKVDLPLVVGGKHANKITASNTISFPITNDFSGQAGIGGFGIQNTSDNDFSLEAWFHPKNITGVNPIFADSDQIGIYWDNGNIVFKLEDIRLDYTVPFLNKYYHVVATYSPSSIKLYVDGELVKSKQISTTSFSNTSLVMQSGPAANNYFLVDATAVYRYALDGAQIKLHYSVGSSNSDVEAARGSFGELFKSTIQHQDEMDKFIYPVQKQWTYFVNDNILYRESSNTIYLNPASTTGEFIESIFILNWKQYISSKVEWFGGNGISVFFSYDYDPDTGLGNWEQCENGSVIPGLSINDTFPDTSIFFFKVVFESDDTSIYVPELYYFGVYLYEDKKLYSHSGQSHIKSIESDIDLSHRQSHVLSRHKDNGIRSLGGGFYIDSEDDISTVELFITPDSLGSGYLFYNKTGGSEYSISWSSNGTLTKSNISNLYINGTDRSSITNISSYLNIDEPNYIAFETSSPMAGQLWINAKYDSGTKSGILPDNLYTIIAIYKDTDINYSTHYEIYTGNEMLEATDSGLTVSEEEVKLYQNDWVLVNNA